MSLPKILMSGRADQIIYLSEEFDPEHTYIHTVQVIQVLYPPIHTG